MKSDQKETITRDMSVTQRGEVWADERSSFTRKRNMVGMLKEKLGEQKAAGPRRASTSFLLPSSQLCAHLVPVIGCGLFSVPAASTPAPSPLSLPTSALNEPPGVALQPGHGTFPEPERSPRWIASCQNVSWDALWWALFLLLPFALLVASSVGLCTDGPGRRTGSLRALGKVLHLSGP